MWIKELEYITFSTYHIPIGSPKTKETSNLMSFYLTCITAKEDRGFCHVKFLVECSFVFVQDIQQPTPFNWVCFME
jgi:hypothetical protein